MINKIKVIHVLSIIMFLLLKTGLISPASSQPVFLGAKSFGTDTPAGRGGAIIKVTNLDSDGQGSFREALNTKGPRIIVFEVGGIIDLNKVPLILDEPFVTIAGQTAPSPGITLIRGGMTITAHDILIKHIRFRMGDAGAAKGFEPDVSTHGPEAYNIVIDHCSFAWGIDENLSISGPRFNGTEGTSRKITLSNNIIAEGLFNSIHSKGAHSMGTLVHDYCTEVAIIGNLFAHNSERNPWFKGYATGVIVNNVIYNPSIWSIRLGYVAKEWAGQKTKPHPPKVAIIGNCMKHGNDTPKSLSMIGTNSEGEAYIEDNITYKKTREIATLITGNIKILKKKPLWHKGLTALPSIEAVDYVLKNAGARPKDRDMVDKRIINDFIENKGKLINSQEEVGGYPKDKPVKRTLTVPDKNIDEWLNGFSIEVE